MFSLGELADRLGLAFSGDANQTINGLASLEAAGPTDLAFLADAKYLKKLASTNAAAVILPQAHASSSPTACLFSENPYLLMARASALFANPSVGFSGAHFSAVVSPEAHVHGSATIGPHVVIAANAEIAADVCLEAGVYVGEGSRIGEGSHLYPSVVVYHGVVLGRGCTVHSNSVLGADGFGFARSEEGWEKIHQLGGLVIGNSVEIGAATTIDRGALDDTVIEDGVIIDNQVQIGHNCRIGKNTAIAGCVGLAGSTIVGANCTLAGGVGVVGHVEICDDVHVTGMTMVTKSISQPGAYSSGTAMAKTSDWKRSAVRFTQLDAMERRLAELEQRDKLEHDKQQRDE